MQTKISNLQTGSRKKWLWRIRLVQYPRMAHCSRRDFHIMTQFKIFQECQDKAHADISIHLEANICNNNHMIVMVHGFLRKTRQPSTIMPLAVGHDDRVHPSRFSPHQFNVISSNSKHIYSRTAMNANPASNKPEST